MSPQELRDQVATEMETQRHGLWMRHRPGAGGFGASPTHPASGSIPVASSLHPSAPDGPPMARPRPPLSPSHDRVHQSLAGDTTTTAKPGRMDPQNQNERVVQEIARWFSAFSVIPMQDGVMKLLEDDERWTGSVDELARAASRTVAITCQRVAEGLDDDL